MAEKKTDANQMTETPSAAAAEENLPTHFSIEKAAGMVGADKAESFFNEVMFAGWGNLSQHNSHNLDISGLVEAANDERNSQRALAKQSLAKVRAVFKSYDK